MLQSIVRVPLPETVISDRRLVTAFQPIVTLKDESPFGFEALARIDGGLGPELYFNYAEKKRRLADLDLLCLQMSLEAAVARVLPGNVFINLHPRVVGSPSLVEVVTWRAETLRFPYERLVLELTEQSAIPDTKEALANIAILQEKGVRFAFDDVGVAYSHLALIEQVRPSFLKISQHFGGDFEKDPTKVKIIRNIRSLAADFGAAVILEGIETSETAERAREMGIELGQGYWYGRPTVE